MIKTNNDNNIIQLNKNHQVMILSTALLVTVFLICFCLLCVCVVYFSFLDDRDVYKHVNPFYCNSFSFFFPLHIFIYFSFQLSLCFLIKYYVCCVHTQFLFFLLLCVCVCVWANCFFTYISVELLQSKNVAAQIPSISSESTANNNININNTI